MRKKFFVMAALALGTFVSVTLTSCGDDDEPAPHEQQDDNGQGGNNGGGQLGEDKSGEIDGHAYVDLGLPSGTLWATCNIGASKPEEYGGYFAWGETVPYGKEDRSNSMNYATTGSYTKTIYSWKTYKYSTSSGTSIIKPASITKYCSDYGGWGSYYGYNGFTDELTKLELSDDAAYVNWGTAWRMPTFGQFEELINVFNTSITWTNENGVNGLKIVSDSNGNSIFLPAAGIRFDRWENAGSYGYYWSCTLNASNPLDAGNMYFYDSHYETVKNGYRSSGLSVRPVRNQ